MDIEFQAVSGLKAGIGKDLHCIRFSREKERCVCLQGGDNVIIYI